MLKPIAAVSLLLTAFISAALSQTSSTTAKSEFQVAAYTRVRVAKPSASVAAVENQTFELINKLRIDAGLEPLAWRNDRSPQRDRRRRWPDSRRRSRKCHAAVQL